MAVGDRAPLEEDLDLGEAEDEPDEDVGENADAEGEEDAGDGGAEGQEADDHQGRETGAAGDEPGRKPGTRQEKRVVQLNKRAREAEARAEAAERQRDDLDRRGREIEARTRTDPQAQARAEAEEAERVSLMEPGQQARYWATKTEQRVADALRQVHTQTQDTLDRQAFQAEARRNPLHRRYADKVEEARGNLLRQGSVPPDRETILAYLVGKEVMAKANAQTPKQRAEARARVRRETTRPGNGRGDAAAASRSGGRTARDRLDGVTF